ncbi:MAG: polyphosphate polymerase domain-containing protein [Polyangiaceae bacterium]|nr:polyphosphate polymerase domain-containing protein [Polyangiaceae bacterium]
MERYEYKYLVPERVVPAIREAALAVSRIDEYARPDGRYAIRSLYFDTPRYDLYWANEREQADRFKVRARCYPGNPGPVFLEVKRRVKDVIVKTRGPVPADAWRDVLRGRLAPLEAVSRSARAAAERFILVVERHHLRPAVLVEYEREAYVSLVDKYARLTFDRRIVVQEKDAIDLEASPVRWRPIDHPAQTRTTEPICVLELKFEQRPPAWMSALVRRLDLVRYSFSKYCYGVSAALTLPELRAARLDWSAPS